MADDDREGMFLRLMHSVRDMMGIDPSVEYLDVPPRRDFPSKEEVDYGRKVGATHGSPVAPMLESPSAKIKSMSLDAAADAYNSGILGDERPPVAGDIPGLDPKIVSKMNSTEGRVTKETQDALYRAYLAAQRSALASLGFDPRRMITTPADKEGRSASVTGAYVPDNDKIWTQAEYAPSNPVHESMHRGLNILRKHHGKDKQDVIPNDYDEERIVRQMMLHQYGPVEEERNPDAVANAKLRLDNFYEERKRLDELERLASQLIAKKHPGGPR